jgi:hypothetical protein
MTPEVLFGLLAPLLVAIISWFVVTRAYRANPAGLMSVLVTAMIVKLIVLAVYTAVMLRVFELEPVAFVATFTSSFIVFHHIEAVMMKRLFTSAC